MKDARKVRATLRRVSNLLLLIFVLCACDATCFHSFRTVQGEWWRADTLDYTCYGLEGGAYGMYVETRTTARYRYKNLVIYAEYRDKSDSVLYSGTVPIVAYDSNGHRVGSTAGMLYQQKSDMILMNLPACDSLSIRLLHSMPENLVEGVEDVGVKLVRLN